MIVGQSQTMILFSVVMLNTLHAPLVQTLKGGTHSLYAHIHSFTNKVS